MKYAGLDRRPHPRRRRPRAGPRRGARATATARSTSSPPTPRCSSCASCSPAAARRRRTGDELRHVVWHDVECGRYDADLPLWHELAREAPEGVLDVGAGTGRVALRLAYAGHDVTALDLDPELLAVLEQRAPPRPASTVADAHRRRRRLHAPASPSAWSPCRCRRSSCCPSATASSPPPAARSRPAAASRVAIATDLEPYDGAPAAPGAGHRPGRRLDLRLPADRDPRRRATTSRSSGSASGSAPTASARRSTT